MLSHPRSRRGVVILVVLSLLVLFVLLVVTFAIVAGQYRRTSLAYARQEVLGPQPHKDLDRAFYQLLRDTRSQGSSLRFHSLLRDYYGGDGFSGQLRPSATLQSVNTTNSPPSSTNTYQFSGGQLMDLVVEIDPSNGKVITSTDGIDLTATHNGQPGYFQGLRSVPGYYKGCVLTITSGSARGTSVRIVDYAFFDEGGVTRPYFRVVAPRADLDRILSWGDLGGAKFVVNGRPFSGTGPGLDDATNTLTAHDVTTTAPVSLVPNYSSLPIISRYERPARSNAPAELAPILHGDMNESYDAVDFQNMFLAWMPPTPTGAADIIPSFHRPKLIEYWVTQGGYVQTNPDFIRRVSMRPYEPNFDGSNPDFPDPLAPPTSPRWDVDNDGDGIPDSVWVDLGFPVQTAADGRRYKPLFAILCSDLDGRLNVNAHDRKRWFTPSAYPAIAGGDTNTVPTRGLGYGPPEIRLDKAGITGDLAGLLDARYGGDGAPGGSGYDLRAQLKFFEEPSNYFLPMTYARSSYSSPSDLRGELRFGVSDYGQPMWEEYDTSVTEARADSPYELNLVDGGVDAPFTPADLERVLRRYDYDRDQLPKRLSDFITDWHSSASPNGRLVTTASFDPPVPAHEIPPKLANEAHTKGLDLSIVNSYADLLMIRLSINGVTDISAELNKMLSWDLAAGLRMDINRPLGDARDNNGNGVVDEPGEQSGETIYAGVAAAANAASLPLVAGQFTNVPLAHTNGVDSNSLMGRQLLARHLYVMALTLSDVSSASVDLDLAREIAQWAINVVDFRDADSIMTPFEYDGNPFNGWDPDGDLTTDGDRDGGGVVWGCERPELLLTESFAFHDRRTYDTDLDAGTHQTHADGDPDYDQKYVPFATAFIELYNPWSGTDTQKTPPQELYRGTGGVALNAVTGGGSPVWRVLVMNKKDAPSGQVEPAQDPDGDTPPTIDRSIYFVPDITNAELKGRRVYYTTMNVSPVKPGQYAVIGGGLPSSDEDMTNLLNPETVGANTWWVSPVGDVDAATGAATHPRRIALHPSSNTVAVYGNGDTTTTYSGQISSVVVPNQSNITDHDVNGVYGRVVTAFSVSEPTIGYPKAHNDSVVDFATRLYVDQLGGGAERPLDSPLDRVANEFAGEVAHNNGTTRGFARVYLQRLANPMLDWDARTNPYRTIDSIPVDLTAFNGLYSFTHAGDPDVPAPTGAVVDFASLERGDSDDNATKNTDVRRLWPQEWVKTTAMAPAAPSSNGFFFPYPLDVTLGLLNTAYQTMPATPRTFPWLVWNNRPYISQYELLQVPRHSSWNLLRVDDTDLVLRAGYWLPTEMPGGASPYEDPGSQGQYPYLVNFLFSGTDSLNAHRLFDYVHVPSRFVGTEMTLNPDYFGKTTHFTPQPTSASQNLLPPFNHISRYRDPGRVNINTIASELVWEAITDGRGPTFAEMDASRRGATPGAPSVFANPFRPSAANLHVPESKLKQGRDIDVTLLREHPSDVGRPLMESYGVGNLATDERNSFFRYELLQRLGNMVTYRSNVYAIWITVGYFEVEPNWDGSMVKYDAFHPDGLRVAQELGLNTGQAERHRAFYIVDRTIPVAFEPGENHNVDRCVLLRRFIE